MSVGDLGKWLRALREGKRLSIRKLAAKLDFDATLLSRLEHGERLPTDAQCAAIESFFKLPKGDLVAARMAEKFWKENRNQSAARRAAQIIHEQACEYRVDKR